jgi:hypothetical protein
VPVCSSATSLHCFLTFFWLQTLAASLGSEGGPEIHDGGGRGCVIFYERGSTSTTAVAEPEAAKCREGQLNKIKLRLLNK